MPLRRLGEVIRLDVDCLVRSPYPELRSLGFFSPFSVLLWADESRLAIGCTGVFPFSFDEAEVESGLGGRLFSRGLLLILGGSGKEPILAVLRTVFGMAEAGVSDGAGGIGEDEGISEVFRVGTEGVELVLVSLGVGNPEWVTDREGIADFLGVSAGSCVPFEGRPESAESVLSSFSGVSGFSIKWLRSLDTGNAGSGPVGGM